jgi:hypothetical protein
MDIHVVFIDSDLRKLNQEYHIQVCDYGQTKPEVFKSSIEMLFQVTSDHKNSPDVNIRAFYIWEV